MNYQNQQRPPRPANPSPPGATPQPHPPQRRVSPAPPRPGAASGPMRDAFGNRPDNQVIAAISQPLPTAPAPKQARPRRAPRSHPSWQAARRQFAASWYEVGPWLRGGLRRKDLPSRRALKVAILAVALIAIFTGVAGSGIAGLSDYLYVKGLATDGAAALQRVPGDVGLGGHGNHGPVTNAQRAQAQADINLALRDFTALRDKLANPDPILSAAMRSPTIAAQLHSGYLLSVIAIDGAHLTQALLPSLIALANDIGGSPVTNGAAAGQGLTVADMGTIQQNLMDGMPYITDMVARLQATPPAELLAALSPGQQAKVAPLLKFVTQIPALLPVMGPFFAVAPAILGIGQPAAYLFMTLDPSEIRPGGGFQGNYAVVAMNAGRLGAVNLQDVYLLDKPYNNSAAGANDAPPGQYLNWWPQQFLPWGLRDANLSADFPTTAGYDLQQLGLENGASVPIVDSKGHVTGHKPVTVTGVIAMEPTVIKQMLALTGPIHIGAPYNVTITPGNLEQEIHYFQLTTAGRDKGKTTTGDQNLSSANKRFTALLAQGIEARAKTMGSDKLLTFLNDVVSDLHTKDIQVDFTDPGAEQFLRDYQISSEVYSGASDGLLLVDTNISGNKGSQYLHETITDTVQLDASGGATHTATISYAWNPPLILDGTNPDDVYNALYNADHDNNYGLYYRMYERLYTAPNPQVLAAQGWQFGGYETAQSDEPGRGMIGAHYMLVGDAATTPVTWNVPTVQVSWYVPHVFTPGSYYTLHAQHQPGNAPGEDITILPPACSAAQPLHFTTAALTTDAVLALNTSGC